VSTGTTSNLSNENKHTQSATLGPTPVSTICAHFPFLHSFEIETVADDDAATPAHTSSSLALSRGAARSVLSQLSPFSSICRAAAGKNRAR
jgi:hypothetical protein